MMNLFLLVSLIILLFNPKNMRPLLLSSSSETKLFDLHSLSQGSLTFLGDSHLQDSAIALTKRRNGALGSAGAVLYSHPILLPDPHSKKVPSFYTKFAFLIRHIHGEQKDFGDGLAFLISPDVDLLGSPGYLGLVDSTSLNRNRFIAIEFDTNCDSRFHDPDDNHVGLDINSLFSIKLAPSSSLGVDLKSGGLIFCWIDYESKEKRLEVFLGDYYIKPEKPLLKVDIDLSDYFQEKMFVGFSGATEGSRQLTFIEQWEFTVVEFSPPTPPPPFPPELGTTFPSPPESRHKDRHHSMFAIALTVGVCSVPFVVLFGWFCRKKLIGMIQNSEGTNNLQMHTMRSSGGISCQDILLSILVDEVARGLNFKSLLDNDAVKTVKSSIPRCNSVPAVKPSTESPCSGLPLRTNDITSV